MERGRKQRIIINALGLLCAGLIMLSGILLPALLLKKQEDDQLKAAWPAPAVVVGADEEAQATPFATEAASAGYTHTGRLHAVLSALSMNTAYPREPMNGEYNISDAVSRARQELFLLSDLGALPDFYLNDFGFKSAELVEINGAGDTPTGVWYVAFDWAGEVVSVNMDAKTGLVLSVFLSLESSDQTRNFNQLLYGFASYYFNDARSFGDSDMDFKGTTDGLSAGTLIISDYKLELNVYRSSEDGGGLILIFNIGLNSQQSMGSEPEPQLPDASAIVTPTKSPY